MNTDPPDPRRGQVRSLEAARTDHLVRRLRSKLMAYLRDDETEISVGWGMVRFFPPELFDEVEPEARSLAVDWLAFVFPGEWRIPLARQLAEDDASLSQEERATLNAWADRAAPGFFRVESVSGRQARLIRLPDDAPFAVRGVRGGVLTPGDLLVTWLLPTGPAYYLGIETAFVDGELTDGLRHILQVEMELLRRQQPRATWDDLYRTSWPRIVWAVGVLANDADVFRIHAPPGPSVLWDGRPVPDAPPWWERTAEWARGLAETSVPVHEEPGDGIERLWWDAALTLRPKQERTAASWTAAVVYAFRRYVLGDPTVTQAEVAEQCCVSPATVGNRSRQIVKALGLEPFDLRYVDLLARDVRILWEVHCIGALGSPALYGGMDVAKMSPEDKLLLHAVLRDMLRYLNE